MTDFHEEQQMDMWWAWLPVLAGAATVWLMALAPSVFFGDSPRPEPWWVIWAMVALVGVLLPWLFWVLKLTVVVDAAGIHIRYRPFVDRHISFDQVDSFRARRYRPIREYGGWGIRTGFGNKGAYNTKGNRGVELYLKSGHALMLGSQRSEELAAALRKRGVTEATAATAPSGSHWLPR